MSEPVCAVLYPDDQFAEESIAAGELEKLLGVPVGRGKLGLQGTSRGKMYKLILPGHESLGDRFLDWQPVDGSPAHALLGRLKPQAEVEKLVMGRAAEGAFKDPSTGEPVAGIPLRILTNVGKYRAALAARVAP